MRIARSATSQPSESSPKEVYDTRPDGGMCGWPQRTLSAADEVELNHHDMLRHHVIVDFREKTFEAEARKRFGFLVRAGFALLPSEPSRATDRRPRTVQVTYESDRARVETCLVLGFGGDDGVVTFVDSTEGSFEFGPMNAHKGHAMRKALEVQSAQVAEALALSKA